MAERYEFDGLQWNAQGYYGVPELRPTEREPDNPADQPWWNWVAAFARIKSGDFAAVPRLLQLRVGILDPVLLQSNYFLFGDACSASQAGQFRVDLEDEDDDETVLLAADALATIGRLADVPALLATYERLANDDDAQILPVYIRDVLGDDCPRPTARALERYKAGVLAVHGDLVKSLGSDNVFLFKGELLNTTRVAEQVLEAAQQPHFRTLYRRKFEAMTGIDCSTFYVEGIFQPLSAAGIVEAFLESSEAAKYKPGVRYFFGHRIPE